MAEEGDYSADEAELEAAIEAVLASSSPKKLVIAGPGTGKTTLFKRMLELTPGGHDERVVLTFINNLKNDLEDDLGDIAQVYTLHAYSLGLLHRQSRLREPLSEDFVCCPGLASLIADDSALITGSAAPHFVGKMRALEDDADTQWYLERGAYYDAVDFDDTVFRAYRGLSAGRGTVDVFRLVLIDEYQDFNAMEAGIIDALAAVSPILIAGDDDQALYSQLRDASWDHIRLLEHAGDYEVHMLPFCMRCPKVVVDAVNDILSQANELERLAGRIEKPFKHFPPVKGADSTKYPSIAEIETSVQRRDANYMGRYIAQAIGQIPLDEIQESLEKGYPTALVIVAQPYRNQIVQHLQDAGYEVDTKRETEGQLTRDDGLALLRADSQSNLGWRIVLAVDKPSFLCHVILATADNRVALADVIPGDYVSEVLLQAEGHELPEDVEQTTREASTDIRPTIKVTSFEGSKGLSAQHVFIAGLHDGELPHDPHAVKDIEICKFIVGLTRTRKKCALIYTRHFADEWKSASSFLEWIDSKRLVHLKVDAAYWKGQAEDATQGRASL